MTAIQLIAGPTAAGKTALAIEAARRLDGEIINADSMQIYDGLPVITACPDEEERAAVPHRLVHRDVVAHTRQDEHHHVLDAGKAGARLVDVGLQGDDLSATPRAVAGQDHLAFRGVHPSLLFTHPSINRED